MKCEICNKEVKKSNWHGIKIENKIIHVCGKHYGQYKRYNKFIDNTPNTIRDKNEFEINGDITTIFTVDKRYKRTGNFIIDTEDLENVISKKWRYWNGRIYTGNFKGTIISRFLFPELKENEIIDHINGNPLDNRKCNLRITTQRHNAINKILLNNNTSGIAGVWFDKNRKKWCAEIKSYYIKCYLGRYNNIEDACYVRYIAEQVVFKEFRNKANDEILIPIANECKQKENLKLYVINRINKKYPDANIAY